MKNIAAISLFAAISLNVEAVSTPEFHQDMIDNYGLGSYINKDTVKENLSNIKIAILERGFAGAEEEGNLPGGTVIVNQYDSEMIEKYDLNPGYEAPPLDEAHGRRVAQLVWAMTGMSHEIAPRLYLLNANGYTNFRRAVRYAIEEKVDIILYAQSWEYGGNYDGKGFINNVVNEATKKDILWINAAGNYGDLVHNAAIVTNSEGNLTFSPRHRYTDIDKLLFTVNSDEKSARILCTWNDFSDDPDYQSVKDLDLFVYEWNDGKLGELVGESCLAQVDNENYAERTPSKLAREEISLDGLRKNQKYAIMVKNISHNFLSSKDKVRIILHANSGVLTFDDHSSGGEIMIPADNKSVIAVGDVSSNSSTGPTSDRRAKPDVMLYPWTPKGQTNTTDVPYTTFSDDTVVAGTSADAAIFAGITAVLKADNPAIKKIEIITFAQKNLALWRINNTGNTSYARMTDSNVTSETRGYYSSYSYNPPTYSETTVITTVRYNPVIIGSAGYFDTPIPPPPSKPPVVVVPPPIQPYASTIPPKPHTSEPFRPNRPVSRHIHKTVTSGEASALRHQTRQPEGNFTPRRGITYPKNEMDQVSSQRTPDVKKDVGRQNPYNRQPQRGIDSNPTPRKNMQSDPKHTPANKNPQLDRSANKNNDQEKRTVNRQIPVSPVPDGWSEGKQSSGNPTKRQITMDRNAQQRQRSGTINRQPIRSVSPTRQRPTSPAPRGISRDKAPRR